MVSTGTTSTTSWPSLQTTPCSSLRVARTRGGPGSRAKEAVRKGLAARFEGIPDVHYGEDRHFVCGDRGASEWTLTGTMTDGVRLEVRGCDLWEFRDGLIVRKDSYWKLVESADKPNG
jgi:ketosteroid isomerase-like protein